MDTQALAETLRRKKRDREISTVTTSVTTLSKNDTAAVVRLEDDEPETAPKVRRTDFVAPSEKGGPSYTVTVPNCFMSLERSIWPEAERFLFPCSKERIKEHTLPRMMSDGLGLIFEVCFLLFLVSFINA